MTDEPKLYDYCSPNFEMVNPWPAFPNLACGPQRLSLVNDVERKDPHRWFYDPTLSAVGSVNVDEGNILYQLARQFKGKPALEIGSHIGFSAWHLLKADVGLYMCDPALLDEGMRARVRIALKEFDPTGSAVSRRYLDLAMPSPAAVGELAEIAGEAFSFVFIDGIHDAPQPSIDAIAAANYMAADAMIVFHDAINTSVCNAAALLWALGWKIHFYLTSQILAVAYRGDVELVRHIPDPVFRELPIPKIIGELSLGEAA